MEKKTKNKERKHSKQKKDEKQRKTKKNRKPRKKNHNDSFLILSNTELIKRQFVLSSLIPVLFIVLSPYSVFHNNVNSCVHNRTEGSGEF